MQVAVRQFKKDRAVQTAAIIKTLVPKAKAVGTPQVRTGTRKGTGEPGKAASGMIAASAQPKAKTAETAALHQATI